MVRKPPLNELKETETIRKGWFEENEIIVM